MTNVCRKYHVNIPKNYFIIGPKGLYERVCPSVTNSLIDKFTHSQIHLLTFFVVFLISFKIKVIELREAAKKVIFS